jgi:hypothetical protein
MYLGKNINAGVVKAGGFVLSPERIEGRIDSVR